MSVSEEIMSKFYSIIKKATKTHTLQSGENIGTLSRMYGLTLEQIYQANPSKAEFWRANPGKLQIGEVINIPQAVHEYAKTLNEEDAKLTVKMTLDQIIERASKYSGMEAAVIKALIQKESKGDKDAVNAKSGAKGLGQLMDGRIKEFKIDDPFNPAQNVTAAATYLAQLYGTAPGSSKDEKLWNALASYNWGPSNFSKWLSVQPLDTSALPRETREYPALIFQSLGRPPPRLYEVWYYEAIYGRASG